MSFKEYFLANKNDFLTLGIVIVVLYFVFKLLDYAQKKLYQSMLQKNIDNILVRALPLLNKIIKVFLSLLIIIPICEKHGISVSSVLTALGIGGVAIGFAAKETIADLFGSISLIADKVFKVGDYVCINQSIKGKDVEGVVEEINFHSTKIRSLDDTLSVIPNNITANSVVTNVSDAKRRQFLETVSITYDTSYEQVKKAIQICSEIILNNSKFNKKDSFVKLNKFSDSSIDILINAYTKSSKWLDFLDAKEEVLFEIYKRFNEEKIEFAFPSSSIYLKH